MFSGFGLILLPSNLSCMSLVLMKTKSGEPWILVLCMAVCLTVLSNYYVHPRVRPESMPPAHSKANSTLQPDKRHKDASIPPPVTHSFTK